MTNEEKLDAIQLCVLESRADGASAREAVDKIAAIAALTTDTDGSDGYGPAHEFIPKDGKGPKELAYEEHVSPHIAAAVVACEKHGIPLSVWAQLDAGRGCETFVNGQQVPLVGKTPVYEVLAFSHTPSEFFVGLVAATVQEEASRKVTLTGQGG